MSTETNSFAVGGSSAKAHSGAALVPPAEVLAIRRDFHELANVFTGLLITGGLLAQHLQSHPLERYATEMCEECERGCTLTRNIRTRLLAACGEPELGTPVGFTAKR